MRVAGWAISSGKGPITRESPPSRPLLAPLCLPASRQTRRLCACALLAADADLEHIKQDLHTLAAPEQFYGHNFLRLTHEASGLVIRCAWAFAHSECIWPSYCCCCWAAAFNDCTQLGLTAAWLASRLLVKPTFLPCRSFTALDALKGWLADQSPAVHVGESEEWLRARQADVEAHAAERLEYDW